MTAACDTITLTRMPELTPFLSRRDRPRILYVVQHADWSGAEVYSAPVMQADTSPLLACPPDSGTDRFARGIGVPTVPLEHRPLRHSGGLRDLLASIPRGLGSALALRRTLRDHPNHTIVYATAIRAAILAGLATFGLRRQVVWVVPDYLPPQWPLRTAIRVLAWFTCARAIAMSATCADELAGSSMRLRRRTTIVPGGVDLARFEPRAGRPARIAVVGAISPTKRTDLAIDVAEHLAGRGVDGELVVIGTAQYRDEDFALERDLRARVERDPSLAQTVEFAGRLQDVAGALRDCRLLLHCRADEPFGMVMVEAMAAGLPVVAPRAGGALEIVVDGETGLLYPPGDAAAAAACVEALLTDSARADALGRAGRCRAESRFTVNGQLAATDAILTTVASS
jgi:glycosyltransferase involved in cell wall biosynthesis